MVGNSLYFNFPKWSKYYNSLISCMNMCSNDENVFVMIQERILGVNEDCNARCGHVGRVLFYNNF